MSDSLLPHGLQHARPPCPSPTPWVYSNSCPLHQRWHPTISFSVVPFSSRLQSFPASGSFPMSQFFSSGGQSIGISASASVLPMSIQDWFPLGWNRLISLQCVGSSCGAQALGMGALVVMMHGLTCSKAGGIFLDQRLKLCPLHWQMDSLSTVPPGKSDFSFFNIEFQVSFFTLLFHPQESL